MLKMQHSRRWFILGALCLLNLIAIQPVFADATGDAAIAANGTCDNGSSLMMITNANVTNGLVATLTQTMVVSGKTITNTIQVSLNPSEKKTLGCTLQNPPPATSVQLSWQVQSAQYK
jgi:hypothetical protein